MVQLWELLKVVKNTKNLSWLWSTQEKTLRPSSVCVSVWFFKDWKIGSLKWFWDPTLQFLIEWRLWDVWDSFFHEFTDIHPSLQTRYQSVDRRPASVEFEAFYWRIVMTPPLVSPLGCGQQSERERGVTGSSLGVPGPASGPGWAAHAQWGQAGSGGQQCSAAQRPAERERESGQCPVSVPGGQSWCDHSVSHYTVHELHTHPHQHNCAACEHCYVSSEQLSKTESQSKVQNCFFFKQALQKSM